MDATTNGKRLPTAGDHAGNPALAVTDTTKIPMTPAPRRPQDWVPKYPADPADPETYNDWEPEDFPRVTPEEIDALGCDIFDKCLAGPDEIDKYVKAVRAYFKQQTPDAYAGARRRLAEAVNQLMSHEWEVDPLDAATILSWCTSRDLPGDGVKEATIRLRRLVYRDGADDRMVDVDRAVVDVHSSPERAIGREGEPDSGDEAEAREIADDDAEVEARAQALVDALAEPDAGQGLDPEIARSFDDLSRYVAEAGKVEDTLKGLLRLAGATLGVLDGYRHRLGLGELQPFRQLWEEDLRDSFDQGYTYSTWGTDFMLGHTLFSDGGLSEQAIADRVAAMLAPIADGVSDLYDNVEPPCPKC